MALDFTEHRHLKGPVVYVLYENSHQLTTMRSFLHELKREITTNLLIISTETDQNGARIADFYDIMTFPAILLVQEDDQINKMWTGHQMPNASEVGYLYRHCGGR